MDFAAVSRIYSAYKERGVISTVSEYDTMWSGGPDFYDSVGESGLIAVLRGLASSWQSQTQRVLDLPCGYGRVARHLKAAFPEADLFFCDLERGAVDFCTRTFGGTGIYSVPELTLAGVPRDLDVIWIGSLFTHLDEDRTARWLGYLASCLAEHGILVATFHGLYTRHSQPVPLIDDDSWRKVIADYDRLGYGYSRYTEHDMGDYGVSLSRPSKLMDMAAEIRGTRVVSYTERGWADNHDVLVLTRNDRFRGW